MQFKYKYSLIVKKTFLVQAIQFSQAIQIQFPYGKSLETYLMILVWFGLVGFYGISTIVGYLMPNPLYTYILNI